MIDLQKYINYSKLGEKLTIANTATFLYNSFISDEGILSLYIDYSTQELIHEFINQCKSQVNKHEKLVNIYSLIFTLLLKSDNDSEDFFNNLETFNEIKWNREISVLYKNRKSVNYFDTSTIKEFIYQREKEDFNSDNFVVKEYSL